MLDLTASDLFDKFVRGITTGLRTVNIRSREAYETLRIKNRIRSLEKERKANTDELGRMIYRQYKYTGSFNEEGIREKCRQVESIEDEIEEWEEELMLVHENARKELGELKAISKPEEESAESGDGGSSQS